MKKMRMNGLLMLMVAGLLPAIAMGNVYQVSYFDGTTLANTGVGYNEGSAMSGLGDGSMFVLDSANIYQQSGSSVTDHGAIADGSGLYGLGNGTALAWQMTDPSRSLYSYNGTAWVSQGTLGAVSQITSMGTGRGLLIDSTNNKAWAFTGSTGAWSDTGTAFSDGFELAGIGAGQALVWESSDSQWYKYNGSTVIATGHYVLAGSTVIGLGNGTALLREGTGLYYYNGTTLTSQGALSSTSLVTSLGDGSALVWDDSTDIMYEFDGANWNNKGVFDAPVMIGCGDGTGLAWDAASQGVYAYNGTSFGGLLATLTNAPEMVDAGSGKAYVFAVPEPATLGLVGIGGLLALLRKKRNA